MPSTRLPDLEPLLRREVERLLGGPLDDRRVRLLGRALADLHARFVSERSFEPGVPYLADRTALAAYLAYFFPASVAQVARAWREVDPPRSSRVRILDVGSGPGPAGWATAVEAMRPGCEVELTAVEQSAEALGVLSRLWPAGAGRLSGQTWRAGAPLPDGPFDRIVASHFINELADRDRQEQVVRSLIERLAPGGLLLLLEPALRQTGRALLELRDRLQAGGVTVLAPCLYVGPCPMLERPRDWCHADRPWQAPVLTRTVAEAAGLGRDSLKYAYLILARDAAPVATDPALFRIVSEPLPEKGKLRYFGCGPAGRHALVRLTRERAAGNDAFERMERGDLVRLEGTDRSGDGLRIGSESRVEVVAAARDRDGAGP